MHSWKNVPLEDWNEDKHCLDYYDLFTCVTL